MAERDAKKVADWFRQRTFGFYARTYGVAALLTFAWVASEPKPCSKFDVESGRCPNYSSQAADGYLAGLLWPAYWLWEGAEQLRGGQDVIREQAIEAGRDYLRGEQ